MRLKLTAILIAVAMAGSATAQDNPYRVHGELPPPSKLNGSATAGEQAAGCNSCNSCGGGACGAGYGDAWFGGGGGGPYNDGICGNICPVWTVRAGAMVLDRSRPSNVIYVQDLDAANTTLLDASQTQFDWSGGASVDIKRHLNGCGLCTDIQLRYFAVNDFSGFAGVDANSGTPPYTLALTPGTYNAFRAYHSTELQSFEANLHRCRNDWLSLVAGFRYLNLRERAYLEGNATAITADAFGTLQTSNELYGFQLGADVQLWRGNRFGLEAMGRAGIFGNDAGQVCDISTKPVTQGSQTRGAFVGEVGLTATYCLTDNWSLYGGYQALWVEGIAEAPTQLLLLAQDGILTNGDMFFHGANFGLEFRY